MFLVWTSLIFAGLAIVIALIITICQKIFAVKEDPIVEKIDQLLPQTQCGQCGYPGCIPYAQAVVNGEEINKCVPGGQETVIKLAELLNREVPDTELAEPEDLIAIIREKDCIGCLHCIEACPVDAIIGAKKLMHVIIPDYCTGCTLCVDPCPVKCIDMIPRPKEVNKYSQMRAQVNMPKGVTPERLINLLNLPADANVSKVAENDLNASVDSAKNEQNTNSSSLIKKIAQAVEADKAAATNNAAQNLHYDSASATNKGAQSTQTETSMTVPQSATANLTTSQSDNSKEQTASTVTVNEQGRPIFKTTLTPEQEAKFKDLTDYENKADPNQWNFTPHHGPSCLEVDTPIPDGLTIEYVNDDTQAETTENKNKE
ncbi:electron transport complex subunit RsxB [Psittacicella hinzii]|uniref:Ion-translocating oxidoreductase complex subunit B n=1 Tax=Psittacicella hinzii TaxID=2028575 RepID=A0A3A1YHA8_9GAMM|nr:electron transport complex subunit RsxB [Psittacicella hinzii]RIY37532.1 electron transport complex subunit RsxB [Psittacicella hinzii]